MVSPIRNEWVGQELGCGSDLTGDGYPDLVISAHPADPEGPTHYVIHRWLIGDHLLEDVGVQLAAGGGFGDYGRLTTADLAGDTTTDLVLTYPGFTDFDNGLQGVGAVMVFEGPLPGPDGPRVTLATGSTPYEYAGTNAVAVQGPAGAVLLVGAPAYDTGDSRIYAISAPLQDTPLAEQASFTILPGLGWQIGTQIWPVGDIIGDVTDDVVLVEVGDETRLTLAIGPLSETSLGEPSNPVIVPSGPNSHSFAGFDLADSNQRALVVGAPKADGEQAGAVYIVESTSGAQLRLSDAHRIDGVSGSHFGARVDDLGDLDGDGRSDLAVTSPGLPGGPGETPLVSLFGSPMAASSLDDASASIYRTAEWWTLDPIVCPLLDFNRDGFDDYAVSTPRAQEDRGAVHIFYGGPYR